MLWILARGCHIAGVQLRQVRGFLAVWEPALHVLACVCDDLPYPATSCLLHMGGCGSADEELWRVMVIRRRRAAHARASPNVSTLDVEADAVNYARDWRTAYRFGPARACMRVCHVLACFTGLTRARNCTASSRRSGFVAVADWV